MQEVQKNTQLGFVFPGQGSQKVGMLSDYVDAFPLVANVFEEAADALSFDLWKLIAEGPQDELNLTQNSQPALLASSIAVWRLWQEKGGDTPAYLAGHSLGEWSALVASGVVAFADALRLVKLRGEYMQSAVPVGVGAMAAIIGMDDEAVFDACTQVSEGQEVYPVNYNSPGQVVIAGHAEAVERAMAKLTELGARKAMPLPVSAPFHTSLMKPAADNLAKDIEAVEFSAPSIPLLHNVGVEEAVQPELIKQKLIEQIYSPVPWTGTVQALAAKGVSTLVECGPGKVLSGLNKRIDKSLTLFSTDSEAAFGKTLESLKAENVAN